MAIIGYARVSSTGQSLDVQLDKLQAYGCEKIYQEKLSGSSAYNRPELQRCLHYVREGDILVITRLDRLARSVLDLTTMVSNLKQQGVDLVVIDQAIETQTPTGKLLFNMLAAIAEFETELRKERQTEGIAKALSKGVKFGAKAKLTPEQLTQMRIDRESGVLIKELCRKYGLSKASVYRLLSTV